MTDNKRNTPFQVLIVGSGKLASELLENLKSQSISAVFPWVQRNLLQEGRKVVVHAGSGRELADVIIFCSQSNSILMELSTSGNLDVSKISFPTILCPNINILMLKFMAMLESYGHQFQEYEKTILESHQATKTSKPGTAINIANSFGVKTDQIISVRDPKIQENELGIPSAFLSRHAYHKISIADANVSITLETKVLGPAPYSSGLARIIEGISGRALEPKVYEVLEFIHNGWV